MATGSPGISLDLPPAHVSDCRFCEHLKNPIAQSADWTVVAETEHLVAVPSIGALVSGWLLVLPKEHILNLAELTPREPVIRAELEHIATKWEAKFGPLTWFEHGPCEVESGVGCSIDHAHMHLVPLAELDLVRETLAAFPELPLERVENFSAAASAIENGLPYLYIRMPDGDSWLAASPFIRSQAFRRIIAAKQGRPYEFDWKPFPRYNTVKQTIEEANAGL